MTFLDKLTNPILLPADAMLTVAVTTLALSGDFTDTDRRVISVFGMTSRL